MVCGNACVPVAPRAEPSLYDNIEKSTVLQECRVFHDSKFVKLHPKRCCQMITKLLYLLTQGEKFAGGEASEVFFGVTKLFQSPDVRCAPRRWRVIQTAGVRGENTGFFPPLGVPATRRGRVASPTPRARRDAICRACYVRACAGQPAAHGVPLPEGGRGVDRLSGSHHRRAVAVQGHEQQRGRVSRQRHPNARQDRGRECCVARARVCVCVVATVDVTAAVVAAVCLFSGPCSLQGSMLGQIERYIKQAIVDNNDLVASSALLCGLQLFSVRIATWHIVAPSSTAAATVER